MEADLRLGDCLDVMAKMEPDSIDTVITDPPYGLSFMGKDWDHGVPGVPYWEAALRVAKPGAMLLAFGGTRTHHRLVCAIEDAGWEVRDTVLWLYGTGFPKSMDISKAIDKASGAEREGGFKRAQSPGGGIGLSLNAQCGNCGKWKLSPDPCRCTDSGPATPSAKQWYGWGTALKPAYEPICLAMKPLDGTFANNALTHGVAGLHIDGVRVGTDELEYRTTLYQEAQSGAFSGQGETNYTTGHKKVTGRWPPNLLTDGSEEVSGLFPETVSNDPGTTHVEASGWGHKGERRNSGYAGDSGSAARFFPVCQQDRAFYTAKASRAERSAGLEGGPSQIANDGRKTSIDNPYQRGDTMRQNHHPTVKPLLLMEWLCNLTKTPTGGIVLDPFMGSGTTGIAALNTHRKFVGIEIDPGYFELAERRIEAVQIQQDLF